MSTVHKGIKDPLVQECTSDFQTANPSKEDSLKLMYVAAAEHAAGGHNQRYQHNHQQG